jgi:hypothetical protein
MANGYRHNHYVPVWYQRRFMPPDQTRYWRLDLAPETIVSGAHRYTRHALHNWSPEAIFAEDDLYTTRWGAISNTEIEQFFFGKLDNGAAVHLDYFANFTHPDANEKAFNGLMTYMSVQKLRTPKGLAYLMNEGHRTEKNLTLLLLQQMRNLFCAIWTECIWQIADASASATKFIVSDHPVTVYNRACPPLSARCVGYNDPDIRLVATHTLFPPSANKLLILTNRSWVRNPYQSELKARPNPTMLRPAMFNFTDIQTGRALSEDEVLLINSIIKRRAYRYISAAEKEWLYPERHASTDHWKKFGDGYLLIPEPRLEFMGGDVVIGYKGGGSDAFGVYGHKPWQKGYKDQERERRESETLYRFKAEWAMLKGTRYTAQCYNFGRLYAEDSEETMQHHRERLKQYKKKR